MAILGFLDRDSDDAASAVVRHLRAQEAEHKCAARLGVADVALQQVDTEEQADGAWTWKVSLGSDFEFDGLVAQFEDWGGFVVIVQDFQDDDASTLLEFAVGQLEYPAR